MVKEITKVPIDHPEIEALHNNVFIERCEATMKSDGGILIPSKAQKVPSEGVVIAVGKGFKTPDNKRMKVDVEVGDHVLVSLFRGDEVILGDRTLIVLRETDIMAILSKAT